MVSCCYEALFQVPWRNRGFFQFIAFFISYPEPGGAGGGGERPRRKSLTLETNLAG
jgi:hypothetical protein